MARILDPAAHALRRDEFIDAAQRLIQVKGYEQLSVNEVIEAVEASKGAFYHYFDSKASLLDAVIQRMIADATNALEPVLTDPDRTAIEKLDGLFSGIANWKTERKELLLAVMHVWLSDDNAIVREKFRRGVVTSITPILTNIVRQGVVDGSFTVTSPEDSARVLVSLLLGANELAGDLFVARQAGLIPFEVVEGALAAYPEAFERILGAHPGSLSWTDNDIIHQWFD